MGSLCLSPAARTPAGRQPARGRPAPPCAARAPSPPARAPATPRSQPHAAHAAPRTRALFELCLSRFTSLFSRHSSLVRGITRKKHAARARRACSPLYSEREHACSRVSKHTRRQGHAMARAPRLSRRFRSHHDVCRQRPVMSARSSPASAAAASASLERQHAPPRPPGRLSGPRSRLSSGPPPRLSCFVAARSAV